MYGGQFVWFLLGWYQRGWWRVEEDTDCTAQELEVAVEGYFSVDIMDINMNNEKLISEQVRVIYKDLKGSYFWKQRDHKCGKSPQLVIYNFTSASPLIHQ